MLTQAFRAPASASPTAPGIRTPVSSIRQVQMLPSWWLPCSTTVPGKNIDIAHVSARLRHCLRHCLRRRETVDLEQVRLDKRMVFGNYATVASPGRHDITVVAERPGARGGDYVRLPYLQP